MKIRKKGIIHGALILTAANIITRIMGFLYRIYMSKAIGAEGMGLYQLITPIYMLAWSISSAGFATTVSNLTARENALGGKGSIKRILHTSIFFTTVLSAAIGIFVFFKADYISTYFLKDSRTALSLKIISMCFPFMAWGSCIRGYFFGMRENGVPASSQVIEQAVRMFTVYILSGFMTDLERACAMAVMGMALGEIISFLYVLLRYYFYSGKEKHTYMPYKEVIILILSMAVPLTLNRIAGSVLSTAENILIPQRLQLYGYSQPEAVSIFGRLCGMAMPLIMFPSSLLTALSTALMPVISSFGAEHNNKRISYTVNNSILLTIIIGVGAGGVFLAYPTELGNIIYSQPEIGSLLRLLGWICPFMYLQVILSGILNGLNKQLFIFKMGLLGSAINIFAIYFLTPKYGVHAFICGWLVSSVMTGAFSLCMVGSAIKIAPVKIIAVLKVLLCITSAVVTSRFVYGCLMLRINSFAALSVSLGIIAAVYLLLLKETDTLPRLE